MNYFFWKITFQLLSKRVLLWKKREAKRKLSFYSLIYFKKFIDIVIWFLKKTNFFLIKIIFLKSKTFIKFYQNFILFSFYFSKKNKNNIFIFKSILCFFYQIQKQTINLNASFFDSSGKSPSFSSTKAITNLEFVLE